MELSPANVAYQFYLGRRLSAHEIPTMKGVEGRGTGKVVYPFLLFTLSRLRLHANVITLQLIVIVLEKNR